jgi:hypothetical protein
MGFIVASSARGALWKRSHISESPAGLPHARAGPQDHEPRIRRGPEDAGQSVAVIFLDAEEVEVKAVAHLHWIKAG